LNISEHHAKVSHLHHLQLWDAPTTRKVNDILKQLSYIQLDTISVVARSQDLICHTRSLNYQENSIWKEISKGNVFEDLVHARCLVHTDDFPFHYSKMISRRGSKIWWQSFFDKNPFWLNEVLDLAESQDGISIQDIPVPADFPEGTGWNRPRKQLLDYLFLRGYLMVKRRENFTKVFYDLPERIIGKLPEDVPDRMEVLLFDFRKTLQSIGPSPEHRLLHYRYSQRQFVYNGKKISARKILQDEVKNGNLSTLEIDSTNQTIFLLPDQIDKIGDVPELDESEYSVFLLSPFDNSLWSREALLAQYKFDYKLEAYTPKSQRKFGFFSLPILWGTQFVGRVDPKLDRKTNILSMKQWSWEKGFRPTTNFWKKLANALTAFSNFHGAKSLDLGNLQPTYSSKLKKLIEIRVK
jgi:uncharacterized protein YcaQ